MSKEEAEEHWKFLESWLHVIYVDAFVHGFKHGVDEAIKAMENKDVNTNKT